MYNEFYGLSEKPFELLPDPKFLFLTSSHREIIASMMDGIRNRKGFISITGEVGTGKTTLIRFLLGKLEVEEKVKTVLIFHPTITFKELLKNILLELDLEIRKAGKKALLEQFNEYLTRMIAKEETLVIIIDEAQDLSKEVMGELGMLPKLTALQIVFAGQPEFDDKLNLQGLRQLKQRIGIKRQIKLFTEEESKDYIEHRLRLVKSSSSERFTPKAISMVCSHARGIPRLINVICDNAFLMGYSFSQKKIDVDIIREVIKDRERPFFKKTAFLSIVRPVKEFCLPPPGSSFLLNRTSLLVLSFLCLAGFAFLIYRYSLPKSVKTWDIESLKAPLVMTQPPLPSPSPHNVTKEIPKSNIHRIPVETKTDSPGLQEPVSLPAAPPPLMGGEKTSTEIVTIEKGQTIYFLAQKYYRMVNSTLMTLILDSNPEIKDVHLILVNQKIRVPKITEELLTIRTPENTYKINAGTFDSSYPAKFYRDEQALKEKIIEILPRKVSPKERWYQVEIGNFSSQDEALKMIAYLKGKGLLPAYGGLQ